MPLRPVPTLDELAADPALAGELSAEVRRALTLRALAVIGTLAVAEPVVDVGAREVTTAESSDRLLTPDEAAAALGVTVPWLYRHAARLPFARKLSRKCLRFSEAGLRRWQAARRV